ncbi:hypothetical protein RJT34_23657 [Clitoria ternatea]|uniref:Uncharacterized protein n=1 Tax=Clitoria ternatea TaxID=43366 RepID=A0AAN9FLN6_CLITE
MLQRLSPLATCLDHDMDSLESSFSFWIEKFPQQSNVSGLKKNVNERQDSTYSKSGHYPIYDTSRSLYSSSATSSGGTQLQDKMEEDFGKASHASDTTLARSASASKDLMGVAQVTIELLHGEAKMWEENARKLSIDVERMRKDLNKKSKNKRHLEMELAASHKENDKLKEEIQQLTRMVRQNDSKHLKFQIEKMDSTIEELKDENKYLKGLNCDLEVKLKKTRETNVNLVTILQKLEKIIEKQKMEIAYLSMNSSCFQNAENNSHALEDSEEEDLSFSISKEIFPEKIRNEFCHSDVDNAIRCLHEGIELQEFRNLEIENQLMQEKQKNMESTIQFLEKTLHEKDQEMQTARCSMAHTLEENEAKWRNSLFQKGKQIINFEKKLSDGVYVFSNEILALTERVKDLEAEFCHKCGESRRDLTISSSFTSNSLLFKSDTAINITEVFLELYKQLQLSVEYLRDQDSPLGRVTFSKIQCCFNTSELSEDAGKIDLKELTEAILCIVILLKKLVETKPTSFEYEINSQNELIRKRTGDDGLFLNEVTEGSIKENIFYISNQELRNIHAILVSEFTPMTKNKPVESADDEHNALFGLEAENVKLSERIFGLEAETRRLIEEMESTHLALDNSENMVVNLKAEISRMETFNEAQKVELKIQEESTEKIWIEAQEECSFLKVANLELQATIENLVEESKTHQITNDELRMQNLELHCQCTVLESKLGESQVAFSEMLELVENLEYRFTSMQEEIAFKGETINADLDVLLQETKNQGEKFIMEEKFLTQMCLEKASEADNLLREVEHLRDQISGICDTHKRIASDIVLEVYDLCAGKAMVEAALQEEQEKVKVYETKLDNLQAEYDVMRQNYTEELAATRARQETLMVDHEKLVALLENVKSNEEQLKDSVRRLKVELKACEFGRLQATEEISELQVQLQRTEMLQDEIFILKRSLYEAEFEHTRLEASYQMLSLECDELKAMKMSYIKRISMTEKVTSELEDYKLGKIELEEKISQLQWDLTTKEASWRNNAQLKYELVQMARENGELHNKKDSLQKENEEYKSKVKDLEDKLKQKKDAKQGQYNSKDCSTSTASLHDLTFLQMIIEAESDQVRGHSSQPQEQHPKMIESLFTLKPVSFFTVYCIRLKS